MDINFNTAQDKLNELKKYYLESGSETVKLLIINSIEKTVTSTTVFKKLTDDLTDIFKQIVESEKEKMSLYISNLKKISDTNEELRGVSELDIHVKNMDKFVVENKNQVGTLSFMFVQAMSIASATIINKNGSLLFNELFVKDLTKFDDINVEKRFTLMIEEFATSIPIIGELISKIKTLIEIFKTFNIDSTIKETLKSSDTFLNYLEEYNLKISQYINHTNALGEFCKDNLKN
jgi:hypothetical protein